MCRCQRGTLKKCIPERAQCFTQRCDPYPYNQRLETSLIFSEGALHAQRYLEILICFIIKGNVIGISLVKIS
jgi:hypothetical protein